MRIAILADPVDEQYAGIHRYTTALIRELLRLDTQHELILVKRRITDDFVGAQQVSVPLVSVNPLSTAWRLFVSIPLAIKQLKPDIVIEPAHFGPFNLPDSIKRVTVIHDLTPLLFPQFHPLRGRLPQKVLLKRIMKNADHVITNSQYTLSDLHHYFPFTKSKSSAVLLGVEGEYKPVYDPSVLEKYGIEQPYFLYLGTIEPRKNLPLLLSAFAEFCTNHDDPIQLIIAGKRGWKTKSFDEAFALHPNRDLIKITGYVAEEDKPALYSQCVAFVYPSLYEGFGLPLLEAMACGAACITTNVSSLPEVGGDAVLYTATDDSSALYIHLKDFYFNKLQRSEFSAKAIARAADFSWVKTAKETLEVLENI